MNTEFQFSIGDAQTWFTGALQRGVERDVSILYWRCVPTFARPALAVLNMMFQFSIGDALTGISLPPTARRRLRFNSLLEMPARRHWPRRSCSCRTRRFQFSIGDAYDAALSQGVSRHLEFQFSIGDAEAIARGIVFLSAPVSILYWRCRGRRTTLNTVW